MLRSVMIALGLMSFVTAASAADLLTPIPVANWTGFYIGANAGYGNSQGSGGGSSSGLDGIFGGGQLGYNWQLTGSPLVIGAEADFQVSAMTFADGAGDSERSRWFGTVRGRLGYAMGNLMPYVTAGWHVADFRAKTAIGSASTTADGWTAGGGLEWMFAPRWSMKFEYLYTDYGRESVTIAGVRATTDAHQNTGRIGFNYHFQ